MFTHVQKNIAAFIYSILVKYLKNEDWLKTFDLMYYYHCYYCCCLFMTVFVLLIFLRYLHLKDFSLAHLYCHIHK